MLACGNLDVVAEGASGAVVELQSTTSPDESTTSLSCIDDCRKLAFVEKLAKRSASSQYCSRDSGVYSSAGYDVEGPSVLLRRYYDYTLTVRFLLSCVFYAASWLVVLHISGLS